MIELLSCTAVAVVGAVALTLAARPLRRQERSFVAASYAAHLASAVFQVLIVRYVYGYGDMLGYHLRGQALADLVEYNPIRYIPELFDLLLHREANLEVRTIVVGGEATGAMTAIAAFLCLTVGRSLYAACFTMAAAATLSKVALYLAFRPRIRSSLHYRLLVGIMLVPSVVFWSSGLLKEPVAMIGLGPLVLGAWKLRERPALGSAILALSGGALIAVVKAYVLFAFICAICVWLYWERATAATYPKTVRIRPLYLALALCMTLGGVAALGKVFPVYAWDNLVEQTVALQAVGTQLDGGSNYELIEAPKRGLLAQLAYAPLALLTTLFRPSLLDVRNGMMLLNALETTVIFVIVARATLSRSWRSAWFAARSSPALMFCAVFTLVFGTAVGLASTNLGTLSRYRTPLMPFWIVLLLVCTARPPRTQTPRAAGTNFANIGPSERSQTLLRPDGRA